MAIIHNGFIDKRYFDSFKDTDLNDADISITKVYRGVKSMWEQLGFENDDSDNPNNINYWKNIIPKDFDLTDREGIDAEFRVHTMRGSKTPRVISQMYVIDEYSEQNWKDGYYYPRIPKINQYGVISGSVDNLFGNKTRWNRNDDTAPITNKEDPDEKLILNITMEEKSTDDLIDSTGLFDVHYNQDYNIEIDKNLRVERVGITIADLIQKNKDNQAY